ncbi:hypothetical protein CC80DRAFT_499022 [Byssothecium circinans]|uniref:BZIP domain-containing protein n=1 Tax=Byssothecium circinans TaxID=147558 RepID=A0A6A5UBY6_9PLEO|nr:hypothetical protein CC80DRAFT_499022 [Byssothecium circinans]
MDTLLKHHAVAAYADEWVNIQDPKERRKAQNRAAQRRYRRKRREALKCGQRAVRLRSLLPPSTQSRGSADIELTPAWHRGQIVSSNHTFLAFSLVKLNPRYISIFSGILLYSME